MKTTNRILLIFLALIVSDYLLAQSKGYGLLIGANSTFNPIVYDRASVAKADKDADDINKILIASGFQSQDIQILKGRDAKVNTIIQSLSSFAKKIKNGDLFVFYFSGHGDTINDINHDELPFTFDQRLILADGTIIDDVLFDIFNTFKDSVRILFIGDACFSGHLYQMRTMFAAMRFNSMSAIEQAGTSTYNSTGCSVRSDSAGFSMMYIGAVDRASISIPYPDGSGRLTKWINDAWHYLKKENLLDSLSMLDFFRQSCFSSSETIITVIRNKHKNVFGNGYVFKL